MSDESPSETRAKILRVAIELFGKRGFHATSVQQIAERVDVSKAAVLYHFREKTDILGAIAQPLLDALDAALDGAELADPAKTRWAVLEGVLEVWLAHRYLMRMNLQDLALGHSPIFDRFRDALIRANLMVAGPAADLPERIRAAQAIAMLGDPVVLFAAEPAEALRREVLHNVRKLFTTSELAERTPKDRPGSVPPPRPEGARRGRKSIVDARMVANARRMVAAGQSAPAIAKKLGISRATLYRHLRRVS